MDSILQELFAIKLGTSQTSKPVAELGSLPAEPTSSGNFRWKNNLLQEAVVIAGTKHWITIPSVDPSAPDQEPA